MRAVREAAAAAAAIFAASVIGMVLQQFLPADLLADSKPAVGAVNGLFTLLLALVLGLLVWTAFSTFTTQQAEVHSLPALVAKLDALMHEYGPDGREGRDGMIASMERARLRFFGNRKQGPRTFTYDETCSTTARVTSFFDSLEPETDRQRRLLASSRDLASQISETQALMARQLYNPLPRPLIVIVVLWAAGLFFGNGVTATVNAVVVGAYLAGASAVGSALFLITELCSPYTGLIRLSPEPLDDMIAAMKADRKG